MNGYSSIPVDARSLIDAAMNGTITDGQAADLESLLENDRRVCEIYAEYARIEAELHLLTRGRMANRAVSRGIGGRRTRQDEFPEDEDADSSASSAAPNLFAGAWHGAIAAFSQTGPLSYLVATVVVGAMLLGAWAYTITHDRQDVVKINSRGPTAPGGSLKTPELVFVGRVTGMKDCRWSDPRTATFVGASVPLSRKYELSSGLLEIAYNGGAKVILEGPCTYEVESESGGFLALGKLTARVDSAKPQAAKTQDPRPKTQDQNPKSPSSLIPHPSSLFSVRTPTAVVTDLGTEFGVEVDRAGGCSAHVFQGGVRVRTSAGENDGEIVDLRESESVRIATDGARLTAVRGKADAAAFVRPGQLEKIARESRLKPFRRWQEHRDRLLRDPSLVAYYDFQQVHGSPFVLRNLAGSDRKLDGAINDAAWTDGGMFGKHALFFRGGESNYVQIDVPREMDNVTVAARVKIDILNKESQGLLMSDGCDGQGRLYWQIFSDRRIALVVLSPGKNGEDNRWIGYETRPLAEDVLPEGKWAHLAVIYSGGSRRVTSYVDGKAVGEQPIEQHVPIRIGAARIANWNPVDFSYHRMRDRSLSGRIEEMVIFARPLTEHEIKQMYEASANQKEGEP